MTGIKLETSHAFDGHDDCMICFVSHGALLTSSTDVDFDSITLSLVFSLCAGSWGQREGSSDLPFAISGRWNLTAELAFYFQLFRVNQPIAFFFSPALLYLEQFSASKTCKWGLISNTVHSSRYPQAQKWQINWKRCKLLLPTLNKMELCCAKGDL